MLFVFWKLWRTSQGPILDSWMSLNEHKSEFWLFFYCFFWPILTILSSFLSINHANAVSTVKKITFSCPYYPNHANLLSCFFSKSEAPFSNRKWRQFTEKYHFCIIFLNHHKDREILHYNNLGGTVLFVLMSSKDTKFVDLKITYVSI